MYGTRAVPKRKTLFTDFSEYSRLEVRRYPCRGSLSPRPFELLDGTNSGPQCVIDAKKYMQWITNPSDELLLLQGTLPCGVE